MQRRGLEDGVYLLAGDVELDVVTGVLHIAHRQKVALRVKRRREGLHLLRTVYLVNVLHGAPVAGFNYDGINLLRHFDQRTRMTHKMGERKGDAVKKDGFPHAPCVLKRDSLAISIRRTV